MQNIQDNAKAFKKLTKTKLCAVVKANAYGHGSERVVCALSGVADCFAVALLSEALSIRVSACGKDVLILSPPISRADAYLAIQNGFLLTVPDLQTAKLVASVAGETKKTARVHLKVNTGMNRYGMNGSMLGRICTYFQKQPFIKVEGIFSHLYVSDERGAREQRELFLKLLSIAKRYYKNITAHLSATYGALLGDRFAFDMVRIGIGLYGYYPDGAELTDEKKSCVTLKKAMKVKAVVAQNRIYSFGGAGYGKPLSPIGKGERIATLRVGYADGFLRKRENGTCGDYKNINNLCMDACVRKVGRARGKYVTVLGDASETAKKTGTISYEVLCGATRRAEFVYDDERESGERGRKNAKSCVTDGNEKVALRTGNGRRK